MNYIKKKISDIGKVVTGKTPPTANKDYYNGAYMFITPNELHGDYVVTKSEKTISEKGLNSISSNTINGISIMVGCIGWDMGNVAICKEKCATNQQINSITDIKEEYNPYYVYYWLKLHKDYLFTIASVTRTPILSKGDFQDIEIPMPEKPIQDKTVRVLVAIDDQIMVNNEINSKLHNMAYETYMHLFYHKKPNGLLGDILTENIKSTIQVGDAKSSKGNIPFFTSGDAILNWDTALVDGRNCYLNTGGNADIKFYIGDASYSTDTWCVSAKDEMEDYLYLLLISIKPELNQKFFQGTGLKHLQKPLLKDRPIYIPSSDEILDFNRFVRPWHDLISKNIKENQQLSHLRDWLLPMLMNGQIEIED